MEVHPSARRHGCEDDDLLHVLAHVLADQEIDEDPTKRLIIGPDVSGNLLEVVVVELDDRLLAIHAMKLRPRYRGIQSGIATATSCEKVDTMPDPYVTKTGRVLTDADISVLADEAEKGYDPARLRPRGRPRIGSGPAEVVPVRLDPEMRQAVQERAAADDSSVSEVVREALRSHLRKPA